MSVKQTAQAIYMRTINSAADRFKDLKQPKEGWLVTMRKALGMSGSQLATRAGVTKAAIYQAERKELAGEVTIKQMEKLARALGGKFVYAIIPDLNRIPIQDQNRQCKARHIKTPGTTPARNNLEIETEPATPAPAASA